jgi:hypothetical protein
MHLAVLLCVVACIQGDTDVGEVTQARWSVEWSTDHARTYYFNRHTGDSSWEEQLEESGFEEQSLITPGWKDCTAEAASLFSSGGLQRVWRRLTKERHPDKGGSTESFHAITEAREFLRSPLRFFAYRQLNEMPPVDLHPLGSSSAIAAGLARRVQAAVTMREG